MVLFPTCETDIPFYLLERILFDLIFRLSPTLLIKIPSLPFLEMVFLLIFEQPRLEEGKDS